MSEILSIEYFGNAPARAFVIAWAGRLKKGRRMKNLLAVLIAVVIFSGCATSTVETRKKEKYTAYAGLAPDARSLVDQGRIKVGMPMDAVYIAWGPPGQTVEGESEQGPVTFWRYFGTEMVEHRFWSYRSYVYGHRVISEPYLDFDYYPRSYESAEVSFANGLVKNWRKMDGQNR